MADGEDTDCGSCALETGSEQGLWHHATPYAVHLLSSLSCFEESEVSKVLGEVFNLNQPKYIFVA